MKFYFMIHQFNCKLFNTYLLIKISGGVNFYKPSCPTYFHTYLTFLQRPCQMYDLKPNLNFLFYECSPYF